MTATVGTGAPWTIEGAAAALRAGEVSSAELTDLFLGRARQWDGRLWIYQARFDAEARAAARAADAELAAGGDRGPLHGIPLVIKDVLTSREGPATAGSGVRHSLSGQAGDAAAVARLRSAGAVILGKVKTSEFAIGEPGPATPYRAPLNPWDFTVSAGGSSSGTAAAIAAGFALGGLGTDTGGSIRTPSACCGTTGLKPTYGRVPRSGCVPLGYSLDTIGPMARSAADCACLLAAIAGPDPGDPACSTRPLSRWLREESGSLAGLRIGVDRLTEHARGLTHPAQPDLLDRALEVLAEAGAAIVDVELPWYQELTAAAIVTLHAEASAYHDASLRTDGDSYGASARHLLVTGSFLTAPDYVQAQRVRRFGERELASLLSEVALVVTPTDVRPAQPSSEPDVLAGTQTLYWNAVGAPALSVPIGFTPEGLPLAMQIAGPPFGEAAVLRAGHAYQVRTDWHLRMPRHLAAGMLPPVLPGEPGAQPGPPAPAVVTSQVMPAARVMLSMAGLTPGAGEAASLDRRFEVARKAARLVRDLAGRIDTEPALIWPPG